MLKALPRGHHRHASRVPHPRDSGCVEGVPRRRRAAVLPRRQRLLLEGRPLAREARRHRDPPRGGRHPGVGGRARGVLQPVRRRVRWTVAPQRPSAAAPVRGRLHRSGQLRGFVLPHAPGRRPTRGWRGCSKASTPRPSATTASAATARRGSSSTARTSGSGTPACTRWSSASSENHPSGRTVGARARGAPHPHRHHMARRAGREADPRRPHLLRDPEGRGGLLHGVHHVLRQPADQPNSTTTCRGCSRT